jgi:hypothetical protein
MANPTDLTSIFSTLIKEINDAGQSDLLKGSVGSIKDLQAVLKEQDKIIDKTLRAGDEKSAMRILKAAKQAQEAQVEATDNLREAKEKLLKLDQEGNAKGRDAQLKVVGKINQEINKLAREAKLMQKNATEFGKGAEHSLNKYARVLENREERIKELGKTGALIEEKFSNRFEGAVSAFTSGVGDLNSFGDTFTSSLKSLGGYLSDRQGKASEKAGLGKGSMEFANMLGGLSKVVSTVAVIGGSIMMLVKLFQFVEGTVLEANKALLEGGVAIEDIKLGTGDTQKNLEKVRDTFRDPDFANAMGIPLADTMALVAGFNSLNMGIKQFGGGEKSMKKMKEAMKDAKGMAFGLGISMDEAQQYMAKFSHDLGVSAKDGSIIGKMAGDFANIRDMALQSSYSTGNFFKKVTELTDQLDNMNYRTKEAGTLFLRFSKVLGKSGLDKALQSLFSGFRSEGYLEQMKRNMLSKSKEVKKALKVEAIKFGKSFKESFGGEDGQGGMVQKLMKQTKSGSESELIKNLANMNEKGRQDLFTEMKKQGAEAGINTDEFTDQLYKFIRLARGTKKKATGAEVQGAQEEMGASGNLKTKFAMIEARVGDRDVNDLGVVAKEALGQFGVAKEQLEVFAQLQTTMKGDLREAQRIAKATGKDGALSEEDKKFLHSQGLDLEGGKLVMKDTRMAVNNFSDYLQTQDEAKFKDLKSPEAEKTQEQYLSEGVKATTSVFNVLNNTIAGLLNDISTGIYSMVQSLFGSELSPDEKVAQRKAINELTESMNNARGKEKEAEERALKLQKQVDADAFVDTKNLKGKDLKKFNTESAARVKALEEAKAEQEKFKVRANLDRDTIKDLQMNAVDYSGRFLDSSKGHLKSESRSKVLGKSKEGKLGKFRKGQKEDMKVFESLGALKLGDKEYKIKSYDDLRLYLADAQRHTDEVNDQVIKLMAQSDLSLKSNRSSETGISRHGTKVIRNITDTSLVKGGSEVAGGQRITTSKGGVFKTTRDKETELSKEALKALKEPVPKSQRDKEAKQAVKATEKDQIEIQAKAIIKAAKETKEEELKAVAKALNLSGSASPDQIAKKYANATEAQKTKLSNLSIGGNETVRRLQGHLPATEGTPADTPAGPKKKKVKGSKQDFWLDGRGDLWSIDPQDLPSPLGGGAMAMTKPGGAVQNYVDQAISKYGGGGGGGNFNITVNVAGSKNATETGRQVVREIRKAQESITGGTR